MVWNTKQGITHSGQWYWDKAGNKICYLPGEGEVVREMIVPSRRNIITLQKNTKNIVLRDFNVAVSASQLRNEEFACVNIDAAITGDQLRNVRLDGVAVANVGGNAIRLKGRDIILSNVSVSNCGGGGIYFSGKHIQINGCRIENMGTVFSGATGIQGYATDVLISRCSITNTPYSGICLGSDSVRIEYCSIRKSMMVMRDGAAIYCGGHKNVDVKNNYIVGNGDGRFTMGIYFDELSRDCTAQNNVVVNTGIPVHCHLSQNILYRNNLFLDNALQKINYPGSSDIALNGNLFIAPAIQCTGPSSFDAKTDTTSMDVKFRKYANPTGVGSFKNNIVYYIPGNGGKSLRLPRTDTTVSTGTLSLPLDKGINMQKILTQTRPEAYFDKKQLQLTKEQQKEIESLFHPKRGTE